jgi:formylmethanofuran dehydrogenase subunit E
MLKDSIAQTAQLERMLQHAEEDVARLRAERSKLPVGSLEWAWTDEALFEARSLRRNLRTALRMAGRVWECERCGEKYGPEWVAAWGLRCHAGCDGWLEEVA